MPTPTPQQQRAIAASGDVLVMAGAGAGKTSTLIARILDRTLGSDRVPLDRLGVVTFTEAAAAEMKHRLRVGLEERLAAHPDDPGVAEQLALLDTAQVSTLHAFCLRLIREHFHDLGLDPQFAVQDAHQTAALRCEVLDTVLSQHYASQETPPGGISRFLARHAAESDQPIRDLILRIHDHARSLPDPAGWMEALRTTHQSPEPSAWLASLPLGITDWATPWLERARHLQAADATNGAALDAANALEQLLAAAAGWPDTHPAPATAPATVAGHLDAIIAAGAPERFKRGTKGKHHKPLAKLFEDALELRSLLRPETPGAPDPLQEDWEWSRHDVLALLDLVAGFGDAFAAAKRAGGVVDFADLEQLTLALLSTPQGDPTPLAHAWRNRLLLLFVDEYQDINAAQDRIIACLGREGDAANRFFVGDVKQSIYRFRRADPRIFQRYAATWRTGPNRAVLPLNENFRSHEAILGFVNRLFSHLLRADVGGVAYDAGAQLQFGGRAHRAHHQDTGVARAELLLWIQPKQREEPDPEDGNGDTTPPAEDLEAEEAQAALAARRLLQWRQEGHPVWDGASRNLRPAAWRDMVVLHPAPRPVAERWARQFALAGIPFEASRGGFYDSPEVADLVNLARILDNPQQDLPLLGVLCSPLAGFTPDDLVVLRVAAGHRPLWQGLLDLEGTPVPGNASLQDDPAWRRLAESARAKTRWFTARFERWRRRSREGSIGSCLELAMAETGFEAWLRAQPRAEARLGNVRLLLRIARQFDRFQRHGVFRFIRHLEAEEAAGKEREGVPAVALDSVRLLSIHQSKGLEFPLVVVAGLGRAFNRTDLNSEWLADDAWGLCPPVLPEGRSRGYRSLPRWLAQARHRRELAAEQVRLFYVACTRASERLVLLGRATDAAIDKWRGAPATPTAHDLLHANAPLAWLGPLVPELTDHNDWAGTDQGEGRWLDWRIERVPPPPALANPLPSTAAPIPAEVIDQVRDAVGRPYPWEAATQSPAKTAVTSLARAWRADEEAADTETRAPRSRRRAVPGGSKAAIERGMLHHLFCELLDIGAAVSRDALAQEAQRMVRDGWIAAAAADSLDLDGLWAFWDSDPGRRVRAHADQVHRELPFTLRLDPADATRLSGRPQPSGFAPDDFQVVQGVVDLAVLLPGEIWVVDFKTDHVTRSEVRQRAAEYASQVALYALALERLHHRPVTQRWLWFFEPESLVQV